MDIEKRTVVAKGNVVGGKWSGRLRSADVSFYIQNGQTTRSCSRELYPISYDKSMEKYIHKKCMYMYKQMTLLYSRN